MTDQERDRAIQQLTHDVHEIKLALLGTITGDTKHEQGLIANQVRVLRELYDKDAGLVKRLQNIERIQIRALGFAAGVSAATTGIIMLVEHFGKITLGKP